MIHHINAAHMENEMNAYRIREKIAYSKIGKFVATVVRDRFFPNSRTHWVQQAIADWHFDSLK